MMTDRAGSEDPSSPYNLGVLVWGVDVRMEETSNKSRRRWETEME